MFESWEALNARGVRTQTAVRAENLPFQDATFDHVTCLGTLLYLDDPDAGMAEMRRVIQTGGTLVLRTVNSGNLYTRTTGEKLDPVSNQLYRMEELKALISAHGFTVHSGFSYGFWPPFKTDRWWYVPERVDADVGA